MLHSLRLAPQPHLQRSKSIGRLEAVAEMAGGAEAARQRDLGDRLLAVPQQPFRPLQPCAHHKLVRRQAGGVLEHAGEMVFAQPACAARSANSKGRSRWFSIYSAPAGHRRRRRRAPAAVPLQLAVTLDRCDISRLDALLSQQVGAVPPVAVEQKLAIQQRDLRIFAEAARLYVDRRRAAIQVCSASCRKCPSVQYRCTNDRSLRTSSGGVLARHDAEPIRPAAVAPAARHLLIALIAVGDVQAQVWWWSRFPA